jgi:hypothetical protein
MPKANDILEEFGSTNFTDESYGEWIKEFDRVGSLLRSSELINSTEKVVVTLTLGQQYPKM